MLMLCIAGATMAQNKYSLQGSLVDSKRQSLPFTNCVLLKAADSSFAYGTTSDLDGVFSLTGVNQGNYLLRITAVGNETYWQELSIAQDTNLGIIEISDNTTLLKEVKITASRPLYSADGEKVFYNVGDDPSVQSGRRGQYQIPWRRGGEHLDKQQAVAPQGREPQAVPQVAARRYAERRKGSVVRHPPRTYTIQVSTLCRKTIISMS